MSRRKQAKPRAFLKHGGVGDEQMPKDDGNLLDPKEEIITDIESDEDDQNFDDENDSRGDTPPLPNNDNKDNDLIDKPQKDYHDNKEHEADLVEPPDKEDQQLLNRDEVYDNDEDDDDLLDNEDANSSDSFYSDLYSTHTSSSYSPSMSEGAATPNSLLHHSSILHPPSSMLHHPSHHHNSHPLVEGGGNRLRSNSTGSNNNNNNNHNHLNNNNHRRRRRHRSTSTANGVDDINEDGYENDEDEDDGIDSGNERVDGDRPVIKVKESIRGDDKRGGGTEIAGKKVLNKIRKIDRTSSLIKSSNSGSGNKMTGSNNGIDNNKNGPDGSYQCQFCDKSFPRLGYLKKHEQSHAEHLPFKCDYCARLFKHKRSRDRHTKLHTGDRRYRCPHCEAAFSRSDHLKIHMKTHDNQKPFQCTVCNRGYNTAAALTSHMQNHKKQAALLGTGLQPLNYSPRSTGSGSSNGSYNTKRKYATVALNDVNSPNRLEYNKRTRTTAFISCVYCTKSDFTTLDQLNSHIQAMHDNVLAAKANNSKESPKHNNAVTVPNFQLNCEYCTMKFPNIPAMFQHMRATHIDRLSSPNSYFENFNRLAASGTFSPRLITAAVPKTRYEDNTLVKVKREEISPTIAVQQTEKYSSEPGEKDDEQVGPTDLSQPKKRAQTPMERTMETLDKQAGGGAFLCNQCNAALPDFETFRNHLKTHIAQGMNLVCHQCGLALRDQTEYERHTISHFLITNTEYSCASNCQKTYAKTEELQKHLFDAHVQIMYKCSLCSDLFDTKVAIQVHFACAHSNEHKLFRCSACMETFRSEKDFGIHVKTRHQTTNGSIQCMFCRAVCSSELEMHFHLAAHARQFRCPSCPETFHVEFLLDRHMQTHHSAANNPKEPSHPPPPTPPQLPNGPNQLFLNAAAQYAKQQQNNNNNSILDYHALAATGKGIFQIPNAGSGGGGGSNGGAKFYSPLQVDTNNSVKHPALMYGLGQRYFDAGKSLLDTMYNYQQEKSAVAAAAAAAVAAESAAGRNYFVSPPTTFENNNIKDNPKRSHPENNKVVDRNHHQSGFSCGMCERNDFRTEAEVHSHRKIVHNLKTGVSLRCAYCSGNFKSRSELEHHMKTCHNSTGKHKCLICDEIFPSPAILAEHKLQHSKVGQSGKCSHCSTELNDICAFKSHLSEHNTEGQIPVQCICCRQTLNSDFEIGLHAKFHTKSSGAPENACALCLEAIPATSEARVCEKCCRKHNLTNKFSNMRFENQSRNNFVENRCNLCKMILPHAQRLQEHLVEHTFVGCEERGYACYICSAVFTVPAGLLSHMSEHGQNSRPYDCNICPDKFFFRAELDNHLIEHETKGPVSAEAKFESQQHAPTSIVVKDDKPKHPDRDAEAVLKTEVKIEAADETEDDEEYIEVEKVADIMQTDNNTGTQNTNE